MEAQARAQVQEGHTQIDRVKLLEVVKKNAEAHKAAYEEAIVGWRAATLAVLKKHQERILLVISRMEADVKEDAPVKGLDVYALRPDLPERPTDHTKDYEALLKRLTLSVDEVWWVSHKDFQRYVLDEWNWKESFTEMVSNYSRAVPVERKFMNYDDV